MFYIIAMKDEKLCVVSDSAGKPRKFSKRSKARNYIRGHWQLSEDATIVENEPNLKNRLRIS